MPRNFPAKKEIFNNDTALRFQRITTKNYFGHGVTLEIKSSTANVIPLTSKVLPSPFHKVVSPWRWCSRMTTGTSVTANI